MSSIMSLREEVIRIFESFIDFSTCNSRRFIVAAKAVGAKGFKAVWTEVEGTAREPGQCRGFVCRDR